MSRVEWFDLPVAVRVSVGARVGAVTGVVDVEHGLTCRLAAVLSTPDGRVFVKGVPVTDLDATVAQDFEAAVNGRVAGIGPLLLGRVAVAGWDVLIFEYVDGRHADLAPGSPHVDLVAGLLHEMEALSADGLAPPFADRLDGHVDGAGRLLLAGNALLHTDISSHNLLVDGATGRVHLVDWAMPAAGPAWVDVAFTAVRLMENGWAADAALEWAGGFASWRDADPVAVEAFVAATCSAWHARVGSAGAQPNNRRFRALLAGPVAV
ncbi:phosphotransferase [Streptomyces sp. V4-01]|uniref:Phosphotransferase n=1 Tax=Actinacidiphila polyblastidii TaxID=3110430 RepID=A0ABU7PK44_9ACTN|nr:phosphotransferase [Streptomyces sp. V4-01]